MFKNMPPPPPPRLPPPPDAPPEPKPFKPVKGSGDKNDVFKEINKGGFKLKKTVTVDKSGPYIPGKVNNINNNNNNNNTNKGFRSPSTNTTNQSTTSNGAINFGDLFSAGMPILKPTGLRPTIGKLSPNGAIPTETNNKSKEINNLIKKPVAARGPPPQPPSTTPPFPSTSKNIVNEDKPVVNRLNSHNKISSDLVNKDIVDATIKNRSGNIVANSSSLHGNNTNNSDNNNVNSASGSGSVVNQRTKLINHGKPNLAPKPPGVKPSPPPKSNVINGRLVNRTQSMRMSRSPPITPTSPFSSSPFGNGNDFNTLRSNISALHQSHETLNRRNQPVTPTRNATLPGRPTQPPPSRPPQTKPPPPPRTGSNTSIIPPQSPPPPPPSLSRVAPPPPPTHSRVAPPPPPVHARPTLTINNSGPPEPPQRGSSMRNGVQISAASAIQEFDSRYIFHSVADFPLPDIFKRINKQYSGAGSKQQAPLPPNTQLQLGTKLWSGGDSSNC
ncbi:WAS/WASL-interacting protein family member 3 isoform X1 [Chrysoperla carnea]|uniref:WAS/WASL-interacting protein family member 3 isoform X1 n=2 Tax=Chrysoperla carnea TaxID=189513 RepID=UPI001D086024|nr:WAS/WASL-interacting protein family member 3 isoform X1 [Chrysoperla carnea]